MSIMQQLQGLRGNIQNAMGPDAGLKMSAIGDVLTNLSRGTSSPSPAMAALMARQERAERMRALEDSGVLQQFTPEQRQILSMMEPGAAQQIIASALFREPETPDPVNLQTFTGPDGTVYQFNPRTGEARPLTEAEAPEAPTTDDIREYEYAKTQGYAGSLTDFITEMRAAGAASSNVVNNIDLGQMTPGQEALDKAYAPEFMSWVSGGGADAVSQTAQIGSVLERLEAGEELTGPTVGVQGDFVRAIMNPDAQDAKERVESVIQRSLRATLGAQFTADEGERLIARAYNVNLSPQQNAARLRALYAQLEAAATAKQAMADHFAQNGTLMGMPPVRVPSIEDMIAAMDQAAPSGGDTTQTSPYPNFETFAADERMKRAAERAGVTVEDMWEVYQDQQDQQDQQGE